MKKIRFLNGNALKIIGAILMTIDHIGYIFFPKLMILRYIGRLSFPIFALMISEGAKYTKNKFKYFFLVFLVGAICQLFYYFFSNYSLHMNILITFSLSILLIYVLQFTKYLLFNTSLNKVMKIVLSIAILLCSFTSVYLLSEVISFDYRIWGILTPVFASLFDFRNINVPAKLKKIDNYYLRLICLELGVFLVSLHSWKFQAYSLLAIFILLFYSEQKGKYNMKYFFYLFYPLHLAFLYGISILLQLL